MEHKTCIEVIRKRISRLQASHRASTKSGDTNGRDYYIKLIAELTSLILAMNEAIRLFRELKS